MAREKKPSTTVRLRPEMRERLYKTVKWAERHVTGRVNIGDVVEAAIAALLDLKEERQRDLIFAAAHWDDGELKDDPRLARLKSILQKDLQ